MNNKANTNDPLANARAHLNTNATDPLANARAHLNPAKGPNAGPGAFMQNVAVPGGPMPNARDSGPMSNATGPNLKARSGGPMQNVGPMSNATGQM